MGYSIVHFLASLVIRLLSTITIEGWDNLPKTGSYIATSNHLGRLEVILIFHVLDRDDVILMIAEKYRSSRFWRWFARQIDGIFIDRFNADYSALRQVLKRLQRGDVLVMAPEGTRSKTGALQQAHLGAAYLASKSGTRVVPVGVTGTWDEEVLENLKRFRRSRVRVKIGEPYIIPPLKSKDREAQLQEYTDDMMCRIAALLPEKSRGYYADNPCLKNYLPEA